MSDQWMSIVEYARTFKVSDMTVRRRIKTGRLHAVLKEGKYYIPLSPEKTALRQESAHAVNSYGDMVGVAHDKPATDYGSEMHVIKGHPHAQRTYAAGLPPESGRVNPMAIPFRADVPHVRPAARIETSHESDSAIPATLSRSLSTYENCLVDTRALLAFCEATLRKVSDSERRVVEKFKFKLEALEAILINRDQEIKSLRQQVEDLQLLVKILEKKKHG